MWTIEKPGIVDYQEACDYQEHLVKLKQEGMSYEKAFQAGKAAFQSFSPLPLRKGENNNFFLVLQHNPVFTKGKRAKKDNILDKSIPVYTTSRGGDLTYHEPGQLVGYIILDLRKEKLNVKEFIVKIENLIIDSLKRININAYRNPEIIGVWLENKKIASIGINIKKGITMHGFALNVTNELKGFKKINPCGLKSDVISSLKEIKGDNISFNIIQELIIEEFQKKF